jgi:natural product biosynthesis luciferase-like monooxygenase protein
MTVKLERYRCILIGAESLLIECGELLLRQGHEIVGVVTATRKVADWAASRSLRTVAADGDYVAALRAEPFDFLFSITHLALIPAEALALPLRGAINFHDGPLPRSAGLNTPVWALLNGETDYAVTWHYLADGVDTGDILAQKPVEIAANDTALTLNTKCFEKGLESFAELIGLLAVGPIVPRPQDFSSRRVYGKHERPAAAGLLDWSKPATELDRLVRALDHGRYRNPLNIAKVRRFGVNHLVVQAAIVDPSAIVDADPGTIVDVGPAGVRVACGEGVLELQTFALPCGKRQPAEAAALAHGWKVGDRFERLSAEAVEQVSALNAQLARGETFWARRLQTLDAVAVPYVSAEVKPAEVPVFHEARQTLPPAFLERFANIGAAEAIVAAFATYLARVGEKTSFDLGYADTAQHAVLEGLEGWAARHVPLRCDVDATLPLNEIVARHAAEFAAVRKRVSYLNELTARAPELHDRPELADGRALPIVVDVRDDVESFRAATGSQLNFVVSLKQRTIRWVYDAATVPSASFATLRQQFAQFLAGLAASPTAPTAEVELLSAMEKRLIVRDWNATAVDYRRDVCIHTLFAEQAARTPDAVAVVFEDRELTYRALYERAERMALHLRTLGIGPDRLVGIHLERSENLVVAVMATLMAGGAYLPLDPNYPDDRIAFMIADAAAPVIITERETRDRLPTNSAALVEIDGDWNASASAAANVATAAVAPQNLAYVIYTSGSTGKPKGVMIEHRNAINFFVGMDQRLDRNPVGTWLAVTSLSFDIHVLELLWTLTRGFKVVVYRDRERTALPGPRTSPSAAVLVHPGADGDARGPSRHSAKPIDFSLFYFSADSEEHGRDKYRLLLEGSRWADEHGFTAVWTPERHFHSFGGLYPNPAVTGAAVAAITKNVQIRAGSVVLPLHHPARVAEQWQVVDNLSNGRVGVSVAAGWQPNDFVLMPENYADAKNVMFRDLEVVKRLWRGESVEFPGTTGEPVAIRTLPRPIQNELPVWITTAGNLDTYRRAGEIGANVLTHLLGQSVEELAPKIAAYRAARAAAGFDPATGIVSLMLHTFVGTDEDRVRETVRGPLKAYLGTSLNLLKQYAWSFPAFKRPEGTTVDATSDFATLSADEQDALLDFAFERYYETSGLFGTAATAQAMVDRLKAIDVNEIACLVDFGIPTETVLEHLPQLNDVRIAANRTAQTLLPPGEGARRADEGSGRFASSTIANLPHPGPLPTGEGVQAAADDFSLAAQIVRHGVTHFQCTPSLARILLSDDAGRAAAKNLKNFLVGGEALPVDLARELHAIVGGRVLNMYGPTETTVWSTSHELDDVGGPVPIGRPLANQQAYILDRQRQPVPVGVAGELYLAGDGVTRGYLHRPELTAERFVADPFANRPDARMYRTGDLVRFRGDGVIEFLGRTDHQVKIRGHRIELGEIESRIVDDPRVAQCVVVPREAGPGDVRLVAYYVTAAAPGVAATVDEAELRAHVRAKLPEYMVPQHFVSLAALPLTPNGKIDRKALPAFDAAVAAPATVYAAPTNDLERQIATLWQELLGREQVGADDNFFDLGGHSLLVVRMHRRLAQLTTLPVALTDLFRFPTVRTLAAHLANGTAPNDAAKEGTDRAQQRRELQERRRRLPTKR